MEWLDIDVATCEEVYKDNVSEQQYKELERIIEDNNLKVKCMFVTNSNAYCGLWIKTPRGKEERAASAFVMSMGKFNRDCNGNDDSYSPIESNGSANVFEGSANVGCPDAQFKVRNELRTSPNIVIEISRSQPVTDAFRKAVNYILLTIEVLAVILVDLTDCIICEIRRNAAAWDEWTLAYPAVHPSDGGNTPLLPLNAYYVNQTVSFGRSAPCNERVTTWLIDCGVQMKIKGVGFTDEATGVPYPPCDAADLLDYQFKIPGEIMLHIDKASMQEVKVPNVDFSLDLFKFRQYVLYA